MFTLYSIADEESSPRWGCPVRNAPASVLMELQGPAQALHNNFGVGLRPPELAEALDFKHRFVVAG